jgi:hypothetical protein
VLCNDRSTPVFRSHNDISINNADKYFLPLAVLKRSKPVAATNAAGCHHTSLGIGCTPAWPPAEAPLACPLPQLLLSPPRLERVPSLLFSSSRQNACLAHSPFLGVAVLAWVESPSRSLVGDALGRPLSSCAESPAW